MKNKNQEKKDHSKKIAAATSLLLVLALVTTSTLAYRDVEQYKENRFNKSNLDFNVVLVENFKPQDDWKSGDKITKEVHVRNGQDSDPKDQNYEDAYVRLKFSEYMGIKKKEYEYSEHKYMVDESGEFIRVSAENMTLEEAKQEFISKGIEEVEAEGRIEEVTDGFDQKQYYYVKSEPGDPNGQWGKKVVTSIGSGEEKPLVESSDGDKYISHLWNNASGYDKGYAKQGDFSKYVNWELDDAVITLETWKDSYHSRPVKRWILDTSDEKEGWVYWGEPLVHNTKNASESITSKSLRAVEALAFPDGDITYDLKVEMEAVSLSELLGFSVEDNDGLDDNHDWNKDILTVLLSKDELSINLKRLQRLVALGDRTLKSNAAVETETIIKLKGEMDSSNKILETSLVNIKLEDVIQQVEDLNAAINAVQSDETLKNYKQYEKAVQLSNNKIKTARNNEAYFQKNVDRLSESVKKWDTHFNNKSNITLENLGKAIDELQTKYYQVVKNEIEIGGQKWRVIGSQDSKNKNFTQAMLVLDEPIKKELFDQLTGTLSETNSEKIHQGNYYLTTSFGDQDILLTEFYNNILKNDPNAINILNITKAGKVDETGDGGKIFSLNSTNLDENIHLTSSFSGSSVSLSQNDKNLLNYNLSEEHLTEEENYYWTKHSHYAYGTSYYYSFTNEGVMNSDSSRLDTAYHTVRPVIWIKVDDNIDVGQEKMPALD